MDTSIGVDLGGTKLEVGLVNANGKVLKTVQVPTEADKGQSHVITQIKKAIDSIWTEQVKGIGVGVPGYADEKGFVYSLTNIPKWKRINLAKILKKEYHVPVKIENDANCFVLAESKWGKGKKCKVVAGLTLGTGVGGGLVVEGKLYRGTGGSTEFGFIMIDPRGLQVKGGMKGTLEAWCSGTSMAKIHRQLTGKHVATRDLDNYKTEHGAKTIHLCSDKLAHGLASIINALNPDCLVIGGGASRLKGYVEPAIKKAKKIAFHENAKTIKKFYVTKEDSGVKGAAALVL